MKLLFDQNISPRLVQRLSDMYSNASHVSTLGLESASDEAIWLYARANNCTIVTKDADFGDLGVLRGYPPQIIWLRSGNCTTHQIELMLRTHYEEIEALHREPGVGVLTLIG
jgi:predicted nuclease of predicted toxin-antitoxin system